MAARRWVRPTEALAMGGKGWPPMTPIRNTVGHALALIVLLAMASSAVGCSGGGGKSSPDPTPAPEPLAKTSQADTVVAGPVSCGPNSGNCTITTTLITDTGHIQVRIDQPVVNQPSYDYFSVVFQPGDQLGITAGGCVQTGGSGYTWKRYTDPQPASDNLYYGDIFIPGAVMSGNDMPVNERVGDLLAGETTDNFPELPAQPDSPHLILGYEDEPGAYGDNGYSMHDNGDYNQCDYSNDGGPAWVVIDIYHGFPGPLPTVPAQSYDLVPTVGFEANGLFLNPRWGWQVPGDNLNDYPATCTTSATPQPEICVDQQTTYDFIGTNLGTLGGLCKQGVGGGDFPGHQNWFDAAFTGTIQWQEFSRPPAGDDDWNVELITPNALPSGQGTNYPDAVTTRNPTSLHSEFDTDETINHFDSIPWWQSFHNAVDSGDSAAHAMIDGHDAVEMGLVGLDVAHTPPGSELHPVQVLAIREAYPPVPLDDAWAIFVRNWGDEGECSSMQHYLDLNTIVVTLPRPTVAQGVIASATATIGKGTQFAAAGTTTGPTVFSAPSQDTQVTFTLPPANSQGFVVGELHLKWSNVTTPVPPNPPVIVNIPDDSGEAEQLLDAIFNSLTPQQQQQFQSLYQAMFPPNQVTVTPVTAQVVTTPPSPASSVPTVSAGVATRKRQRDLAMHTSLCIAVNGSIPGYPDGCQGVAPLTTLSTTGGATGNNGWVVSPVTVTLTAQDASGTGIAYTEYSFDNVTFTRYTGPFVEPEGETTLYYRSADNAGDLETAEQQSFKIDTRAPSSTATATLGTSTVTVSYLVLDPAPGSGPAGLHTISHGSGGTFVNEFTQGASGSLVLDTMCPDIEYWGEDIAGNQETPHNRIADTVPPVLTVAPTSFCMWPPNHDRFVFRLGTDVTTKVSDVCDTSPTVQIVSVTSNEPDDSGDATFSPSAFCVVRTRDGSGSGRVYTVTVQARDYAGNTTNKEVQVLVPHNFQANCAGGGTQIADTDPCQ